MTDEVLTHYRKVFDSPYLSSADIVGEPTLTIHHVVVEKDHTKKTKDEFNTAYFVEKELRPGENLKPMILNATNSKTMKRLTGTPFIEQWKNVSVTIYVDPSVRFGKESVEGLRISPLPPGKKTLTPQNVAQWEAAKGVYRNEKSLDRVLAKVDMSHEHQMQLMEECTNAVA